MLVELFNSVAKDVLIEVRLLNLRLCLLMRLELRRCVGGLLLDPEAFRGLEVVSENRDDFLNLIVGVGVDEEHVVLRLLLLLALHAQFYLHLSAPARHRRLCEPFVLVVRVEIVDHLSELV